VRPFSPPVLHTLVHADPPADAFGYGDELFLTGSCFSESIGRHLQEDQFKTCLNPFGIVYNPVTMAAQLRRLVQEQPLERSELVSHGGLWHSPWHHGRYSHPDPATALEGINRDLQRGAESLRRASRLILTWGQTRVFLDRTRGIPVANCHKRPAADFTVQLPDLAELIRDYRDLLGRLRRFNPGLAVWITISPVRYTGQGIAANSRSKALLHLLAEALGDSTWYFPAYEILLDELRDYRYYADDLLHPSPLAVSIIYQRFLQAALDPGALTLLEEVRRIRQAQLHRPLHPDTEAARQTARALEERLQRLRDHWPSFPHLFNEPAPGG
jgi:hypothetical protein